MFGCSFTRYYWPTWADILSKEMPNTECFNYGKSGAGNPFMFYSLMEAHAKYTLSKDDLVIIMWTNTAREDRYVQKNWLTPGNIYTQTTYDDSFVKKFADDRGYLIRDLSIIRGAKEALENMGVDYSFLSMVPIANIGQYSLKLNHSDEDVLAANADLLAMIKPSVFEVVFNFDWTSRPFAWNKHGEYMYKDRHPIPDLHLEYLTKTFPETVFSENIKQFVNNETSKLLKEGVIACNSNHYLYRGPLNVQRF